MTNPTIAPENNAALPIRSGEQSSGVLNGSSSGGGAATAPSPSGVPVLLSQTHAVTASGVSIDLDFSTSMARGAGRIYITDGAVQTVFDRVTGQPTMRIVGATDTKIVSMASVVIDGSHVTIEASGLKAGLTYSVVMAPGVLVSETNKPFAGVSKPAQVQFQTPGGDTQAPTLTSFALDGTVLKAGADTGVTLTFSEKVSGLTAAALSTPNATLSDLHTTDGGTTWVARLAGGAGTTAPVNVLGVDMSQVRDAAGNAGTGVVSSNAYAVDTVIPAVASVALSGSTLGASNSITATIVFTEAVSGLTSAAISAPHATLLSLASSDGGITWVATLSAGDSNSSSGNVLTVDAGMVRDAAGNAGSGSASAPVSYTVDVSTPAVAAINFSGATLKQGGSAEVTILFTEDVVLTEAAISAQHATLSNLHRIDALSWGATLQPGTGEISATGAVSIDMGRVLDLSGNAGSGIATSDSYLVDTIAPRVVSIELDGHAIRPGQGVGVTIVFSEKVLEPGAQAIDTPHVTLEDLHTTDGGTTWQGVLTTTAATNPSTGDIVSIDQSQLRDIAGNQGHGTFNSTDRYEVAPPLATIRLDHDTLKAGDSIAVTISFAESVTGFHPDAFTTPNATLTGLHPVEGGNLWRATLTVAGGGIDDATNVLSLDMSKVHYLSGYADSGNASSGNYAVDSVVGAHMSYLFVDDYGASDEDYITSDALHFIGGVFVGDLEDGQSVELVVDGQTIPASSIHFDDEGAPAGTHAWYYEGSHDFPDGLHHISARLVGPGNHASAEVSQDVTIDTDAPDVIHSPDGDQSFGVDAAIVIEFDQEMYFSNGSDAIGGTVELVDMTNGASITRRELHVEDSNLSADRKTLTIYPGTALETGSSYRIELPASLTDLAGNNPQGYQITFRTAGGVPDVTHPELLKAYAPNEYGHLYRVGQTINIHLGFDEPVRLSGGSPTVMLNTGSVATFAGINDDGRELVFAYTIREGDDDVTALRIEDSYQVMGLVTDLSGNQLMHIDYSSLGNIAGAYGSNIEIDGNSPLAPSAPVLMLPGGAIVNAANLTNAALLEFHGSGAERDSDIDLYEGDRYLGSTYSEVGGAWSIEIDGGLGDGEHVLTVRQTDAAGNQSAASAALTITIDRTAPGALAAPALAAGSDTGVSAIDGITRATTPMFTGMGAEANTTVRIVEGDVLVGETTSNAAGEWSITARAALAERVHTVQATQVDHAGNQGLLSAVTSFTIDSTAPSALAAPVLAASSDTGDSASDHITRDTTPTFTGSGAAANGIVRLYEGTTQVGEQTADASGNWSVTASLPANGVHQISAVQVDTAGNESTRSGLTSVTIDTVAPAVAGKAANDISGIYELKFSEQIVFARGGVFDLVDGAGSYLTSFVWDTPGPWSIGNEAGLPAVLQFHVPGTGAFRLVTITDPVQDLAGNAAILAPADLAFAFIPALAAPALAAVSDSGASATDRITKDTTPTFTGSAATPNGSVRLYDGGTRVGEAIADATGAWTITASTLADGVHQFSAVQVHASSGIEGIRSPLTSVTVDTVAPALLNASLDGLLGDTFSLKFNEQIVFAEGGKFDLATLLGISVRSFQPLEPGWSIETNEAGVQAVLELHIALGGAFRLTADNASVQDLAGNSGIVGTPHWDFTTL